MPDHHAFDLLELLINFLKYLRLQLLLHHLHLVNHALLLIVYVLLDLFNIFDQYFEHSGPLVIYHSIAILVNAPMQVLQIIVFLSLVRLLPLPKAEACYLK